MHPIEYKYIIAPYKLSCRCCIARWEDGPDRIIDPMSFSKKYHNIRDKWNFREVRLLLNAGGSEELSGSHKIVKIRTTGLPDS